MTGAVVLAFMAGIVFGILLAVSHPIYGALRDSRAAKRRITNETLEAVRKLKATAGGARDA